MTYFGRPVLGFMVYLLVLWSERSKSFANMLEPFSSILAAIAASAITLFDPLINVPLVILL